MNKSLDRFLARWFLTMDHCKDGYIDCGDFIVPPARLATAFGHPRGSVRRKNLADLALYCWEYMVQAGNLHPDGLRSEDDFKRAFSTTLIEPPGAFDMYYMPLLSAMMDTIDGDGDGKITVTDATQYFYALFRIPESSGGEISKRLDRDGDGFIATSDLLDAIRAAFFDHSDDSPSQWLLGPLDQSIDLVGSNNNNNNNNNNNDRPYPCIPRIEFHIRRWWGFELHCDDCAVEFMEHFRSRLFEAIGRFLPRKVRGAIHLWLRVRSRWIEFLNEFSDGIRYLSPWPIPILLTPLPMRKIDWGNPEPPLPEPPVARDTRMRWTLGDLGRPPSNDSWSEAVMFPSQETYAPPALIEFNDQLYCMYQTGGLIHHTRYSTEYPYGWCDGERIPTTNNFATAGGPGLGVFQGRLYVFIRNTTPGSAVIRLLYSIFDPQRVDPANPQRGGQWSPTSIRVPDCTRGTEMINDNLNSSPAVTVFRGELYVFFRGSPPSIGIGLGQNNNEEVFYRRLNRNFQWHPQAEQVGRIRAISGVAVTVQRDRLICVYGQGVTGDLMLTSFDGQQWSAPQQLHQVRTKTMPAIISHQNQVYGVVREADDRGSNAPLRLLRTFDPPPGTPWPAMRDMGRLPAAHQGPQGVALSLYTDRNMTDPNAEDFDSKHSQPQEKRLMVVYRPV